MKKFNDKDFLLNTKTARHLYFDYASKMPIIDYHCHLSPKEIYEDVKYENITQLWLLHDHYKWRQMRSNGIEEEYITGNVSDEEKFYKWANTLSMAIGNPLYHWSHLELKKYFGYEGYLNDNTAKEVWKLTKKKLSKRGMSARSLIEKSNVEVICTTDDPADDLMYHKKIKEDGFKVKVLPSFRPDKALAIEKEDFKAYIEKLGNSADVCINDYDSLLKALELRVNFFNENGCRVSDHGLPYVMFEKTSKEEANDIFVKKIQGNELSELEVKKYKTALLTELGKMYADKNWVMQLHFGVQRDLNKKIYNAIGADAGIDAIDNKTSAVELGQFLNELVISENLPKTILYSLNPIDNAMIGTVIGCFQDSSVAGKIQHGAAWWFNDHKSGMIEQMTSLANLGLLGRFVGMLTDSRSFLSYTRHEYFRRIMCNFIGDLVENGEYPNDEASLKKIVEGISYYNAKTYFGF